ncbi:hypothetical protein MAR_035651 [Mya arenaria]|uniref:Uncharacterized protein n=1 Tax=Mya arenaria TaxID=6604 RepID=A0ABY7EL59_MYAAR|nr:hypothetical protein MAR_035651 [Mya arenaria]
MDVLNSVKIFVLFELHFTSSVIRRDNCFMPLHVPLNAVDGIGDSDSFSQTSSYTSSNYDSSSGSSSSRSNTQSTESSTSQTSESSWTSSQSPNYKVVGVIPSYLSFPTSGTSRDSDLNSDTTKSCSDDSHTPTPAPPPSKVELGHDCSQYPYCKDLNAECRRDGRYQNIVCTCRHGWHFVKAYGIGGICTPDTCEDTGCPSPMVCRDGKCEAECPPRTIYVNGECRFDQWGEACVCSPDTCVEADTECQDGYCECKDPGLEYSHYLNMCVGQNYGDPCSTYQDTCDKHIRLQCINGECTCPHGTRPVQTVREGFTALKVEHVKNGVSMFRMVIMITFASV